MWEWCTIRTIFTTATILYLQLLPETDRKMFEIITKCMYYIWLLVYFIHPCATLVGVSSSLYYKYTISFRPIVHLQVHNLVCTPFKINVIAMGSFVHQHCASYKCSKFAASGGYIFSLALLWGSLGMLIFSGFNLLCLVVGHYVV